MQLLRQTTTESSAGVLGKRGAQIQISGMWNASVFLFSVVLNLFLFPQIVTSNTSRVF